MTPEYRSSTSPHIAVNTARGPKDCHLRPSTHDTRIRARSHYHKWNKMLKSAFRQQPPHHSLENTGFASKQADFLIFQNSISAEFRQSIIFIFELAWSCLPKFEMAEVVTKSENKYRQKTGNLWDYCSTGDRPSNISKIDVDTTTMSIQLL